MAVNGGVDSARSRARALLDDVGPGDHDHPDFRDVASGGILWKASLVLLHFLERNVELRGKRVLEISAGEGHLACELQRYGAHVTATEPAGLPAHGVLALVGAHLVAVAAAEPGPFLPLNRAPSGRRTLLLAGLALAVLGWLAHVFLRPGWGESLAAWLR